MEYRATQDAQVRAEPVDGMKVAILKQGTKVVQEAVSGGWLKFSNPVITRNADKQWVEGKYLELVTDVPPETPPDKIKTHDIDIFDDGSIAIDGIPYAPENA